MFCSLRYRSGSDSVKESHHNINNNNNNEKKNPLKPFERMHSQRQRLILIILVSLLLSFFSASESAFFAFSATYFQYIPLELSASRAAELVSLMALTFTLSRGMAVVIAIKTKPHNIIAIFLTILLISLIILFFASNSLPLLRFGILTMSFGFSPIYASIFSLMGRYVEFTSQIGTVLMLSANSLNLILPYILGKFIEENPNIFLLTLILNITFSVFIFISIIYFVYQFKQNTYNQKNYEITDHPNVL